MLRKKIIVNILIFAFLIFPLSMWIFWIVSPRKHLNVLIMDKTVLTKECREHRSLNWILSHNKYVKTNQELYSITEDYFGFFPLANKKYSIKDLSFYNEKQIDSLSNIYNAAYYTDTYGIYSNEWYSDTLLTEHSEKIYGGLEDNDFDFLKKMKEKKKLIIGEFNFFATPTSHLIRTKIENLFHLKWTGWTGRYFYSLDTLVNRELPQWVVKHYKKQHNNKWNFKSSGIVFVNDDETIAVLENKNDLEYEVPIVKTFPYGVKKFGVPRQINYPYWFEITLSTDTTNKTISYFEIKPNRIGDSIMQHHNIPKIFPATIEHQKDYPFYYFCADFCDVKIDTKFQKFKWINYFELFVINENDVDDRTQFFWRYYYPLTSKVLNNYYSKIK